MRQRQVKTTKNQKDDSVAPEAESPPAARDARPENEASPSLCRRCLRGMKYLVIVLMVPPFLNYASLNKEATELQPPGTLYDIGQGQKLFLNCQGEGKPTVILEAPTGMMSDVWALVQPEIAKHTKVCSYDRAGLGFSERPPVNYTEDLDSPSIASKWKEFTVERMVDDLYRLVTYSSQQDKPFVFVGAELGALIGRFYAQIYEGDVSDLVLIDPLVEGLFEQDQGVWSNLWFRHLLPYFQAHQLSAAVGASRIALILRLMAPPLSTDDMPEEVIQRQKHLMCNPRHLSSVVDEHHFINDSLSQIQTALMLKAFPSNISLTVINGNYFDEQLPSALNKAWAKSQQTLLSQIHPSSNHIVVNGADHHMIYRHPQAVTEPIKRLVKQWRARHET